MPNPSRTLPFRQFALALACAIAMLALGATSALAVPSNDNFADATAAETLNGTASLEAYLNEATVESGEPTVTGSDATSTVWYVYRPLQSGYARFGNCSINEPHSIAVFTGSTLSALTPVASGYNNCPQGGGATTAVIPVTAGRYYRIQIGSSDPYFDERDYIDFSTFPSAPANDNLVNAQTLTGSLPIVVNTSNYLATGEASEDSPDGSSSATTWFKFSAPSDGRYAIDTCDSPDERQDSALNVYTSGASNPGYGDLTELASSDDDCQETETGNDYFSRVVVNLDAGQTVWIQLGNYSAYSGAHYKLRVSVPTGPFIDDDPPRINGDTLVGEELDVNQGDWDDVDDFSYQWLRCDLDGDDCSEIADADDNWYETVASDVGHTIRVRVTASNSDGETTVETEPTEPIQESPANDDVVNATALDSNASVEIFSSNRYSSTEDPEPSFAPMQTSSVWFKWTAPADGSYSVSTCGGQDRFAEGPRVGIFTSSSPSATNETLSNVFSGQECGSYGSGSGYEAKVDAAQGTTYWIGVAGSDEDGRPFRLTIGPAGAPAFTLAPAISGSLTPGTTINASPGKTSPAGSFDYAWSQCDLAHQNCVDLPNYSGSDAVFVRDQLTEGSLRLTVTASNPSGSATAFAYIDGVPPVADPDVVPPITPATDPVTLRAPKSLGSFKVGKKGSLTFKKLKVSCAATALASCVGTVKITAKIKKKTVTLGSATLKVAPGKSTTVKLKLKKSGLKAVKKAKKLKASLSLSLKGPGFAAQKAKSSLTLKR